MSATIVAPSTPVETVTPLKPSELLRLGRLLRPQWTACAYFDRAGGACAVGAMAVARAGSEDHETASDIADHFESVPAAAPCSCVVAPTVWAVVTHLSDSHHPGSLAMSITDPWPDSRIADWLESVGL